MYEWKMPRSHLSVSVYCNDMKSAVYALTLRIRIFSFPYSLGSKKTLLPLSYAFLRVLYIDYFTHKDIMLLSKSKSHFWSVSTTSKHEKEIFLFSKRISPNSFPIAALLMRSPSRRKRKRYSDQRKDTCVPVHMLGSRFQGISFFLCPV